MVCCNNTKAYEVYGDGDNYVVVVDIGVIASHFKTVSSTVTMKPHQSADQNKMNIDSSFFRYSQSKKNHHKNSMT